MTRPSPSLNTSALARPLVPSVPSNRFVVGGFVAVTLAARLLGRPWSGALEVGGAGFLAWSTARELDPDHPGTANATLPVAAVTALLGGAPQPLAGLTVLSALRVLAATVGNRPTLPDLAALAGQAALSALLGERAAALVPGVALGLSAGRADSFQSPAGGAGVVAAAALLPSRCEGRGRSVPADLLTLAALGLSGVLTAPEAVTSRCDQLPLPVSAERVRLARGLALGSLGAGLLTRQTRSLAPLAAAALLVGLRRAGERQSI